MFQQEGASKSKEKRYTLCICVWEYEELYWWKKKQGILEMHKIHKAQTAVLCYNTLWKQEKKNKLHECSQFRHS